MVLRAEKDSKNGGEKTRHTSYIAGFHQKFLSADSITTNCQRSLKCSAGLHQNVFCVVVPVYQLVCEVLMLRFFFRVNNTE